MMTDFIPKTAWLLLGVCLFGSCSKDQYTLDDFQRVKKIDTHMHLNTDDPALVDQAKADNFVLLSVNVDVPGTSLEDQSRFARIQAANNPDYVKFLTAFSLQRWDSGAWEKETLALMKTAFAQGALGVKIWKNIGMVYKDSSDQFIMIDNPRFDPVINYIISQNKTVMGHLGEPRNCWLPLEEMTVNNDRNYFKTHPQYHMYLHPEYPSYEDQINARDRFLERHPDMRFVAAHLASLEWDVDELAKRFDRFPNMAADMAARIPHLQHQAIANRDKVRDFFIHYQDRIVYGTDSGMEADSDPEGEKKYLHDTWMNDWKFFVTDETMNSEAVNGSFQGLALPKEVVDKIYYSNAVKWFGMNQGDEGKK